VRHSPTFGAADCPVAGIVVQEITRATMPAGPAIAAQRHVLRVMKAVS
jgi:hypothetical protein